MGKMHPVSWVVGGEARCAGGCFFSSPYQCLHLLHPPSPGLHISLSGKTNNTMEAGACLHARICPQMDVLPQSPWVLQLTHSLARRTFTHMFGTLANPSSLTFPPRGLYHQTGRPTRLLTKTHRELHLSRSLMPQSDHLYLPKAPLLLTAPTQPHELPCPGLPCRAPP